MTWNFLFVIDLKIGQNFSILNIQLPTLIIDVEKLFNKAALNVVWHITASERFDYGDPKMEKLVDFIDAFNCLGNQQYC